MIKATRPQPFSWFHFVSSQQNGIFTLHILTISFVRMAAFSLCIWWFLGEWVKYTTALKPKSIQCTAKYNNYIHLVPSSVKHRINKAINQNGGNPREQRNYMQNAFAITITKHPSLNPVIISLDVTHKNNNMCL